MKLDQVAARAFRDLRIAEQYDKLLGIVSSHAALVALASDHDLTVDRVKQIIRARTP